jgi:hypothetical protein
MNREDPGVFGVVNLLNELHSLEGFGMFTNPAGLHNVQEKYYITFGKIP